MPMFDDLRSFVAELDRSRQLRRADGADWNLEIGTITELMVEKRGPALFFDKIKDYPEGYRVVTNIIQGTTEKVAFGFSKELFR